MSRYTQQQRAIDERDATEFDLDYHDRSTVHNMADWIAEQKRLEAAYNAAREAMQTALGGDG